MSIPRTHRLRMSDVRQELDQLLAQLPHCRRADRDRLRGRLRGLERALGAGRPIEGSLTALAAEVRRSRAARERRLAGLPKPAYPRDLPVAERRGDIAELIAKHQVVIVCGETGSGKTTQLPKICLELGRGVDGMIGHTQPRRIAARSVAARIAQELGTPLGEAVGYKVRFNDRTRPDTYVKLMTDGILLAETQSDRFLDAYDTIIIDEAHERSLNIDFLLGYVRQLLPKRPDLKVIITSATINPRQFSEHFGGAPVIEVSGRTYPVEVRYRPMSSDDPEEEELELADAVLHAVDECCRDAPLGAGSIGILVFLPGEREIREVAEALRKHRPPGRSGAGSSGAHAEVIPLYARLSSGDQQRVFDAFRGLRIVLATNVAETSLTVPGINFVIDPGLARISRYNARTKVQRLPIERVSQASADQRKGRCGRVSEGICIRLYSEADFLGRPAFTEPEILRTSLASVILQMKALRMGDIQMFPFVEPPDYRAVSDGFRTLFELGAIDDRNELTPIGQALSRLPTDPRIGRMILAAADEDCLEEVLVIASALSVQDPRDRPMDQQQAADEAHRKFRDERSDFLSFVKLWDFYHHQAEHLSGSKLRKLCQTNFLSYVRMREWHDTHQQLHGLVTEMALGKHGNRLRTRATRPPVAPESRNRQEAKM